MGRTQIKAGQSYDIDFVSEAELASTGSYDGVSGAEKSGIRDTGTFYAGENVELALQELGPLRAPVESFESASGGSITLKRNDTEVLNGDVIGKVDFKAKDANAQGGVYESVASIEVQASEEFSGAATAGTKMIFRTNAAGTETPNDNMVLNGEDLTIEGFVSPRTLDMECLGSAPDVKQGRFYFNSAESKFYGCHDGVNWKLIGGGGVAGSGYKHTQSSGSTTWTVQHNLNYKYVNVECYDSNDNVIIPESIVATDANTITITFLTSRTGTAVISAAAAVATAGFLHTQSVAATSWVITHGLNDSNPVIQVYDASGNVILPDSIVINSATQLTIGFLVAQDGKARILAMGTAEVTVAKTIAESENGVGVTIDGVLLKDSQVTTDQINEKTGAAGVTVDGVKCKDSTVLAGMLVPGQTVNLALSLSGTTLTVNSADGTALSTTNPGYICIPSKVTLGGVVVKTIISNLTLDMTAIDGFEFGITAGVNWGNNMPFFIHAASDDSDNLGLFISRDPTDGLMPVANSIGDAGADPVTDSQIACICFSDITPADFESNPRVCIGAFRMQYTGATTRWAVQTLAGKDGIGQSYVDATCATTYTMPAGQNGAAAGKYWIDNHGTAPSWNTTNALQYTISRQGLCNFNVFFAAIAAAPGGVGAVTSGVAAPYASASSFRTIGTGCPAVLNGATLVDGSCRMFEATCSVNPMSANSPVQNAIYTGANDYIGFGITYKAF